MLRRHCVRVFQLSTSLLPAWFLRVSISLTAGLRFTYVRSLLIVLNYQRCSQPGAPRTSPAASKALR